MAPLSKDSESVLVSSSAAPPAPPVAKSPAEISSRPQPVAVEIPVTINGAHNVNGSAKREPFSESTNTVLLFTHGAVVRVATPLAPGQLVFLTNEKTKNEIVCQVVKSKSGGSNTYVELKFTEPAPGFWGVRTTTAADSTSTATPVASKTIPPAPPVVAKPEAPKPVMSAATVSPLAPPAVTPSLATAASPLSAVPPPPPASAGLDPLPSLTTALMQVAPRSVSCTQVPPAPPAKIEPPMPPAQMDAPISATEPETLDTKPPIATFQDFSKEINALFGVPMTPSLQPPAAGKLEPPAPASTPSTQELKVHAAELQAKLSALLFTETPAPSQPSPVAPEASKDDAAPVPGGLASKLLELAQEETKPTAKIVPEPPPPPVATPKPLVPALSADDEVKIPAWLAPLSQNSESASSERSTSSELAADSASALSTAVEDSPEIHADLARRSQAAVFGGQLLGETAPAASAPARSRSGLFVTVAAAVVLIAAAAAWYFLYGPGAATNASVRPTPTTSSLQQPSTTSQPQSETSTSTPPTPESTHAVSKANSSPIDSPTVSPLPSKSSSPSSSPAVFNPVPERKSSNPPAREITSPEPQKKASLGNVHLAAPVLSRGHANQPTGGAEPGLDMSIASPGAGDSSTVLSPRNGPAAPVPVGGDVKPAALIKSVAPVYPQLAKTQRVSGSVQIDALVDESGNVAETKVISGPQLLHRAALDAVKQWKYKPATLNGQPTAMHLTVVVQFRTQ